MARAATLSALALAGALSVAALPAEASTSYRYWSYWHADAGSPQWRYAVEGSGTRIPGDGSVEGWRFGIAADSETSQPGLDPDFAAVCAGVEASDGHKRVAVVIDSGSLVEAPEGEAPGSIRTACVVAAASATGLQVLQQVTTVRMDAGFVCGIDGYPARECAPLVELPDSSAQPSNRPAGATTVAIAETSRGETSQEESGPAIDSGTPLVTAIALSVLALAGFGVWRHRRRVSV